MFECSIGMGSFWPIFLTSHDVLPLSRSEDRPGRALTDRKRTSTRSPAPLVRIGLVVADTFTMVGSKPRPTYYVSPLQRRLMQLATIEGALGA